MSALIEIYNSQDSWESKRKYLSLGHVVGHALLVVVKNEDGGLNVERILGVNADSAEDNQIVGDFIKQVESKLAELFPEETPKIWTPE